MYPALRKGSFLKEGQVGEELRINSGVGVENRRDSYGRLVAYVYVDGQSIQQTLLKEGFARVGYIMNPPYKYLTFYREDENLAKRSKLNIWSRPNFVTKWGFNGCVP